MSSYQGSWFSVSLDSSELLSLVTVVTGTYSSSVLANACVGTPAATMLMVEMAMPRR